jgi:exodeoxyribonuclease-3
MKSGARARNIGWRIDYFFVSDELRGRIKAAGIMPLVQGSDHCPITLEIG